MFALKDVTLKEGRYIDYLYIPNDMDIDIMAKSIYEILSLKKHEHKRLVIVIDKVDEVFLKTLIDLRKSIKLMGYRDVSLEVNLKDDIDFALLRDITDTYMIPFKLRYHLSSSDDNIRYRLENDVRCRIDPTCIGLKEYQDYVRRNTKLCQVFRNHNHHIFVSEIDYDLVKGENDSLFECAMLQYYARRYDLAITLTGDEDSLATWLDVIREYSKEIIILNKDVKRVKGKTLKMKNSTHTS